MTLHGIAGGHVRFGAATWFADVLLRFGYDFPEHEHPWDGEWIDDAFEAAALRLRATGSKLLRALDRIGPDVDAEETPLWVDLAAAYLASIGPDLAVAVPCCYGVEGRVLEAHRAGGLDAVVASLAAIDPVTAAVLCPPPAFERLAHEPSLFAVVDAAGERPALPRALDRARDESAAVTADAVAALDAALAETCGWLDAVVPALQAVIASRAEDGDDLLARWAEPDWAVVRTATPNLLRHLPVIGTVPRHGTGRGA